MIKSITKFFSKAAFICTIATILIAPSVPVLAAGSNPIADGMYEIRTKLDTGYVLDVAGPSTSNYATLQLWEDVNVENQRFKVISDGCGYYTITSSYSGKVLDTDGNDIFQNTENGSDTQKWAIKSTSSCGYYYLVNKSTSLYADVDNAYADCGTNVKMFIRNDGYDAQKWSFSLLYEIEPYKNFEEPAVEPAEEIAETPQTPVCPSSDPEPATVPATEVNPSQSDLPECSWTAPIVPENPQNPQNTDDNQKPAEAETEEPKQPEEVKPEEPKQTEEVKPEESKQPEEPAKTEDSKKGDTSLVLKEIPIGTTWNGSTSYKGTYGCFAFAKKAFKIMYGVDCTKAYSGSKKYNYGTPTNMKLVSRLAETMKDVSVDAVKNALIDCQEGDILQVGRYTSKTATATSPHTMVVESVNNKGITVIHGNYGGKVARTTYTWASFKKSYLNNPNNKAGVGVSVYRYKGK